MTFLSKKMVFCFFVSLAVLFSAIFAYAYDSTNVPHHKMITMKAQRFESKISTKAEDQIRLNMNYPANGTIPSLACPAGYATTNISYGAAKYYEPASKCIKWEPYTYCANGGYDRCECGFQGCPWYCLNLCNNNSRKTGNRCTGTTGQWVNSETILKQGGQLVQSHNIATITCSKIINEWTK